jgi:hypothetical protein
MKIPPAHVGGNVTRVMSPEPPPSPADETKNSLFDRCARELENSGASYEPEVLRKMTTQVENYLWGEQETPPHAVLYHVLTLVRFQMSHVRN